MDYERAYKELLTGDRVSLRERIAMRLGDPTSFNPKLADTVYEWITQGQAAQIAANDIIGKLPVARQKKIKARTKEIMLSIKPKRQYTKKAKYWANPVKKRRGK